VGGLGYDGTGKAVAEKKPVKAVVGGSAYSNAPQIGAGTWSDSVAIGETAVYRVRLDHGQRFRVTASAPAGSEDAGLTSGEAVTTRVTLFSPARLAMTTTYQSAAVDAPARATAASPEVRVRNRETPSPVAGNAAADWSTASVAGDYFVGVQLDPIQRYLIGRVMSVRLSVAADGEAAGQPQYAASSPSAPPSPTDSDRRPTSCFKPEALNVIIGNEVGTAMLQDAIWATADKLPDLADAEQTTKFIKASIISEAPPETAKSNTYVEKALAELKAEGIDVKGSESAPLTVTLNEGGD